MKNMYNKKELNIKLEELPFNDFLTTRYTMTVRLKAQNTYDYAEKNNISFFNMIAACILEAINEIPEFKRRIIDDKVIEYEKMNAIIPIMQKDYTIKEIEILPRSEYESLQKYNEYIENKKNDIENNQFLVEPGIRDSLPICSLSCIPGINFECVTNSISSANQMMPIITWGKLVDGKIPISVTISHIFVFGYQLHLLYQKIEENLKNPESLV